MDIRNNLITQLALECIDEGKVSRDILRNLIKHVSEGFVKKGIDPIDITDERLEEIIKEVENKIRNKKAGL